MFDFSFLGSELVDRIRFVGQCEPFSSTWGQSILNEVNKCQLIIERYQEFIFSYYASKQRRIRQQFDLQVGTALLPLLFFCILGIVVQIILCKSPWT